MTNNPEEKMQLGRIEDAIRTGSSPSDLKITDIRLAVVCSNYDYPIIRIDTNQGVYGIGEVRDAGHKENALQFKSMLLGQNPCNVDMIFRAIKRYGGPGREGGGVSGLEIALWDLVGKVYGVPCWQFLGGKYRDQVRIYADTPTPEEPTPEAYAARVLGRKALGLTFIKFDIIPQVLSEAPGALIGVPPREEYALGQRGRAPGWGYGAHLTDAGIARLVEIVAAVREAVGWGTSLCIDHFGHGHLTA
jgi:L-alanine-DL-glutamate epimerase-like enolase superfamily enzyme